MNYPALPSIEPQGVDEPLPIFRARLVRFLLAMPCTATMSDAQLEQAQHGVYAAVAGPLDDRARPHLVEVQRLISATLARRASLKPAPVETPVPVPPSRPNNGPMARLVRPLDVDPFGRPSVAMPVPVPPAIDRDCF